MLGQAIPKSDSILEVALVGVLERTEVEIELVAVGRFVIEALHAPGRRLRARLAEAGKEIKGVRQKEGAVVMKIVEEPVGNRRLRRDGFQCRMSIDHAGRRVKARIRDSPDPHVAV